VKDLEKLDEFGRMNMFDYKMKFRLFGICLVAESRTVRTTWISDLPEITFY